MRTDMRMKKEKRFIPVSESGMMVVEALLSFSVFVMVVAAVVYLITIYTLHNRIQFAINSAAHELAAYSYLYQATGLKRAGGQLEQDGAPYVSQIDDTAQQLVDTYNKIESLQGSVSDVEQSVSGVVSLLSNPNDLFVGGIYMAGDTAVTYAKSGLGSFLAKHMTEKYLSAGEGSADAYLKKMGVTEGYGGLDFSGSSVFCDHDRRMIDIVVTYDIDLGFVRLIVPEAKLHMVQRVTVAGWVDGDGRTLDTFGVNKR